MESVRVKANNSTPSTIGLFLAAIKKSIKTRYLFKRKQAKYASIINFWGIFATINQLNQCVYCLFFLHKIQIFNQFKNETTR